MDDNERNMEELQRRLQELETLRDQSEGPAEWRRRLDEDILTVRSQLLMPTTNNRQPDEDRRVTDG